ncbi:MAG: hypothetical protein ACRCZO_14560, partial [Cetobacterium sp.]
YFRRVGGVEVRLHLHDQLRRRNPLQSSANPEKGAGLAMGLAVKTGEGEVLVDAEAAVVVDTGVEDGGCGVSARRNASTSSWNGS